MVALYQLRQKKATGLSDLCACGCKQKIDRSVRPNSKYFSYACSQRAYTKSKAYEAKRKSAENGVDPFFAGF